MSNDLARRRLERAVEKLEVSSSELAAAVAELAARSAVRRSPRLTLVEPLAHDWPTAPQGDGKPLQTEG